MRGATASGTSAGRRNSPLRSRVQAGVVAAATVSVAVTTNSPWCTTRSFFVRMRRTATAVLSLSAEPPSLLVSIDRTCRLAELVLASGRFSVAMLASDQENIADAFAGKLGGIDRFSVGDWQSWSSGTPHLSSAAASIDCELIGSMSIPTHLVIAGAIVGTQLAKTTAPLLWHRRQYHRPAPLSEWPPLFAEEPQPWPTPAD